MIKAKAIFLFSLASFLSLTYSSVNECVIRDDRANEGLNSNITFGPDILLNRTEIKDSSTKRILVSRSFIDSCIYWYRRPLCWDPKYSEDSDDVLYAQPLADSIIIADFLMEPDYYPIDTMGFHKESSRETGISQSKVVKEFSFQGKKISLSIYTHCGSPCFEYSGGCFLSSYLSFFEEDEIRLSMMYAYLNHTDMYRRDLISVIANDTIISLYTWEQQFDDPHSNGKLELLIARRSISDVISELEKN